MSGDPIMQNLRLASTGIAAVAFLLAAAGTGTTSWNAWEMHNYAAEDAKETYSMGLAGWSVQAKVGFIEHTVTGDFNVDCDNPYDGTNVIENLDHCEDSNDDTDFYLKIICNMGVYQEKVSDEKDANKKKIIRSQNRNMLLRGNQIAACNAAKAPRELCYTLAIVATVLFFLTPTLSALYYRGMVYFPKINWVIMVLFAASSALATLVCFTYTSQVSAVVYTHGNEALGYSYMCMWGAGVLGLLGFGVMLFDDGLRAKEEEKTEFDDESSEISETSESPSTA